MLGPPGGDPQYPSVQGPTQLPAAGSAAVAARAPSSTPAAAGDADDTAEAASSRVRLLRPTESADAGAAPTPEPPAHGYLPDPPLLLERARWLYEIRYDRGSVQAGAPALQCLERPTASVRRIGRFAFELWLGAELIERVRFDFPLLGAEEPRSGPRRPLREDPSFAPGARVSVQLHVPASARATRAQILDRATGQTTPVDWPPRAGTVAELCGKAATEPTPSAR